ncbi:MAG TPA: hypothetical protein VMR34_00500 [Candidatus Saccharimonadales bacterium]|nr:hypothetical protein [Candidatus Saccharimonadales bacterium]
MSTDIRPTKKQKRILDFIDQFISINGYSPSYREVKNGLDYSSLATVALHIDSLINRGHLKKRDHSARSLEPVKHSSLLTIKTNEVKPSQEKWLVDKVEYYFSRLESGGTVESSAIDELYVLLGALKVLGLSSAAQSFMPRLSKLKQQSQPG